MKPLRRILVVDDNEGDLTLLAEAILQSGVPLDLTTCMSGHEALKRLATDASYALILSDINMPGINGIEFLRAVTVLPVASTIPVVLMSSSTRDALPARIHDSLDRCPYFTKPCDWRGFMELAMRLDKVTRECGTSEDAGEALGAQVWPASADIVSSRKNLSR